MTTCPKCGAPVSVLLFMGVQPDGFVCTNDKCRLYYSPDGEPLARVL
jgi:hypothetical protein